MKFTFNSIDEDGTHVTLAFETDRTDTLVEHMENFMKGCGFFPRGPLVIDETSDNVLEFPKEFEVLGGE